MLRLVVTAVVALFVFAGILIILCGFSGAGWQVLVFGALVLIGTLFERWRYRAVESAAGPPGQPTGEKFLDPATGQPIEVYFDPRTGERRYVADEDESAPR